MTRLLAGLLLIAAATAAEPPIAGIWQGEVNGLPAIQVTVKESAGKYSGRIVFYFQERGPDGKWQVKDPDPGGGQMLAVQATGKSIRFEVEHHKQHGGTELGPNVPFRVDVTGADEARLFKLDAPESGQGLKLVRKK